MFTRRWLLKTGFFVSLLSVYLHPFLVVWAKMKKILPKGFSREILKDMHPEEVDNRNLEIDPIEKFGIMGTSDISIDLNKYRLKVGGKVKRPLSISYDQILKYPQITESVLLICPGFFAYNARWTGIGFEVIIRETQPEKGSQNIEVKGVDGKTVKIPLSKLNQKRIFLAYRVNGEKFPERHGFPLRLVYEDAYGSEWVKYVNELFFS